MEPARASTRDAVSLRPGSNSSGELHVYTFSALRKARMVSESEWVSATPSTLFGRGSHIPELTAIDTLLRNYRHARGDMQRIEVIHAIETTLYAGVSRSDRRAKPSSRMPAFRGLLDAVQAEHIRLVARLVTFEPEALAHLVSGGDVRARIAWQRLVRGEGRIIIEDSVQVPRYVTTTDRRGRTISREPMRNSQGEILVEDEVHPNFRATQLANFVRLMRTRPGRRLVNKINDIGPRADRSQHGDLTVHILPMSRGVQRHRGPIGEVERKDFWRLGGRTQTGSLVNMPDFRDSSADYARSASGRTLLAPVWLMLGHELIHVKHNLQGKNRRDERMSSREVRRWTNTEERHTIADGRQLSENILRSHAGLTVPRGSHRVQVA